MLQSESQAFTTNLLRCTDLMRLPQRAHKRFVAKSFALRRHTPHVCRQRGAMDEDIVSQNKIRQLKDQNRAFCFEPK